MENNQSNKKEITNKLVYPITALVVVVLLALGVFLLLKGNSPSTKITGSGAMTKGETFAPTQAVKEQKLTDQEYYKFAYQIFPGPLTSDAKTALTGFSLKTQQLPDGSTKISLTTSNPNYKNQQYIVKKGYKLYFIERNLADDNQETNEDRMMLDDQAVMVDSSGFIAR